MVPSIQTQETPLDDQVGALSQRLRPEQSVKIQPAKMQPWKKLAENTNAGGGGRDDYAVSRDEHGFAAGELFMLGHGGRPFKSVWTRVV